MLLLVTGAVAACGASGQDSTAPTSSTAASTAPAATSTAASSPTAGVDGPPTTLLGAPDGDAFWIPPDPLPDGKPGDLIWARTMPGPIGGGTAWQVLYRTSTEGGDPAVASGVVVIPPGPPPAAPRPVVALAHSTTGIADRCAPSRTLATGGGFEVAAVATGAVAQGWVLAATDYRGLGTPGVHPYLVGQLAGRDVLDIVRAAGQMPGTGADAASPVAVLGHSQGGGAAVFAAELAPGYAPELNVVGAVAGAPATELGRRLTLWPPSAGQDAGFAMMSIAGFHAAYPGLGLGSVLSDRGQAALPAVEDGCVGEVLTTFGSDDPASLFTAAGPDNQWRAALQANVAGEQPTGVPVYVFHGEADTVVPVDWSADYQTRACATGTDVTRVVYPGLDHGSVVLQALEPAFAWLEARVGGEVNPPGCPGR